MTRRVMIALSVMAAFLAASMPMSAHHGRGDTYNGAKTATSKAIVTEFDYSNPHVRMYFDTKDEAGNVTNWSGEMANVSQFVRAGWTKKKMEAELKPGAEVTVTYRISTVPHAPGKGASIVTRILNAKGEIVGLERGNGGE
jgi:hypothetical protein